MMAKSVWGWEYVHPHPLMHPLPRQFNWLELPNCADHSSARPYPHMGECGPDQALGSQPPPFLPSYAEPPVVQHGAGYPHRPTAWEMAALHFVLRHPPPLPPLPVSKRLPAIGGNGRPWRVLGVVPVYFLDQAFSASAPCRSAYTRLGVCVMRYNVLLKGMQ